MEQNNHTTKIVNAYIVSELDSWPGNLTNNLNSNCFFGATKLVENYRIAFDGAGSWDFVMTLLGMLKYLVILV